MDPSSTERALREYTQWLSVERGRSRATIESYSRDLRQAEEWAREREASLLTLNDDDLREYISVVRGLGRAPTTLVRIAASLRGFYGYCLDERILSHNPTERLDVGRRGRTLPKPISEETMLALLDSVTGDTPEDLRDRTLLEMLYGTGARVSELTALTLSNLDFDEKLILVTGKGNKQRLVPMGRSLESALLAYLSQGRPFLVVATKRTEAVFLNSRGGGISRQGVDLIIQRRALAAGIDRTGLSAHVFRHSCATHMLAHGADIRVVQELLGHASISTTQLYTAVSITSLKQNYLNAHPRAVD